MITDDDKIILDASIINTEVLGSQHLLCDKSDILITDWPRLMNSGVSVWN